MSSNFCSPDHHIPQQSFDLARPKRTVMDNGSHGEADDTDELLCADGVEEAANGFCLSSAALCRDHCDLLLDAIDDQLSRLQTRSHGRPNGGNSKMENVLHSDPGLGTTSHSTGNTASSPNESNSNLPDNSTEVTRNRVEPRGQQERGNDHVRLFTATSWPRVGAAGPSGSKTEQCLWRLERLLGTTTGVTGEKEEEEESVCTEDFSSRFRDVMLDIPVPSSNGTATDSVSSDTVRVTEAQMAGLLNTAHNPIPLRGSDLLTTDSDLDSVHTERVLWHIQHTLNNKTAWEGQNGSCDEEQTLSSDEGQVKGEYVRHCRKLKTPNSIQRKKKRTQSQRNNSTPTTPSAAAAGRMMESLRAQFEQAGREQHTRHVHLSHCRAHTHTLRSDLHRLQTQRDLCVTETRTLQESQAALQKHTTTCNHDASPHRTSHHYDTSPPSTGCYHDDCHHRCVNSRCVSALEREEMDRLVDSAKSELFSEQRRFRHTLESLQERLEEVTQDLEQKEEVNRKLRERCSHLEEELSTTSKHREEPQESVQIEQVDLEGSVRVLGKTVAQKEMLLLGMQEEKNCLEKKIRAIQEEHNAKLTVELTRMQKKKEQDIERLKAQWTQAREREMELVHRQAHEATAAALRDQALTHTRNTESLRNCIQIKEQEVTKLHKSLEQQQELLRRQEEELKRDTEEQVSKAVAQAQRECERQSGESLREQRGILEEREQEAERRSRGELEHERRCALTLQNKVLELQMRVDELEREESAHTAAVRALRDEQQKAESRTVLLKQRLKQSQWEIQDLKAVLAESERVHKGAAARQEQQSRSWAQDILMECVWLQELLTANGMPADTIPLSPSGTVGEALQVLQALRNPLQHLITSLQSNITSLTHTTQQLSADKELELCLQREQLTAEKQSTLNSLKEKLIQEHIEELSCVSRWRLREDDDGSRADVNLHQQMEAQPQELRRVQRIMGQQEVKTTARLSRGLEEELTSELERSPRPSSGQPWRLDQHEGHSGHLPRDCGGHTDVHQASVSSTLTLTPRSHDLTSHKLLRHLQSRIRQLQADRRAHTPSPAHLTLGRQATDLAGSYLEMIAPVGKSCVSRQHPSARTPPC